MNDKPSFMSPMKFKMSPRSVQAKQSLLEKTSVPSPEEKENAADENVSMVINQTENVKEIPSKNIQPPHSGISAPPPSPLAPQRTKLKPIQESEKIQKQEEKNNNNNNNNNTINNNDLVNYDDNDNNDSPSLDMLLNGREFDTIQEIFPQCNEKEKQEILHFAVSRNDTATFLASLLENNAVLSDLVNVFIPAELGLTDIISVLIQFDFDFGVVDWFDCTPLWRAVSAGREEVVAVLLSGNDDEDAVLGVDVNAADYYDQTPLFEAVHRWHQDRVYPRIARRLIAAGARIDPHTEHAAADSGVLDELRQWCAQKHEIEVDAVADMTREWASTMEDDEVGEEDFEVDDLEDLDLKEQDEMEEDEDEDEEEEEENNDGDECGNDDIDS